MHNIRCWCGNPAKDGVCLDSEYHDPDATGRPDKVTSLYVAGPMSGYAENNYPAFHEAARRLRDAGYMVSNPAEYGTPGGGRVHYVDLLREDLRAMLPCQGIAVLENWWESSGARNEVNVAGLLLMPVRSVSDWLGRANTELTDYNIHAI